MHQALTSSQIAAATAAWTAAGAQALFGMSGASEPSCDEISFAFDRTPSHCFPIDQGGIGVTRFADSASRVYSLSPLSDDDHTSAGGAGGADAPPPAGSGGGDGSDKPVPKITAYDVFHALLSIPLRHEVRFGEELVVYLLHEKRWIEEIDNSKREVMKDTANGLEKLKRKLELVRNNLAKKESTQHKLKTLVESIVQGVTSMFSRGGSLGIREKTSLRKLKEDIEALRVMRDDFEEGIARAKIARAWLDRIGRSEYGYVFLNDAGLEVLGRLKPFKDDQRMEYMSTDEFLSKIVEGS
jgi:hypothetical protein